MSKGNEAVFPQEVGAGHSFSGSVTSPGELKGGLIKREYFAAMAMQGQLSDGNTIVGASKSECAKESSTWEAIAIISVKAADALLAELEKARP